MIIRHEGVQPRDVWPPVGKPIVVAMPQPAAGGAVHKVDGYHPQYSML
jgi:hypothetical protein